MKIPRKILKPMVDRLLPICQRRTTIPMLKHLCVTITAKRIGIDATSIEEYMSLSAECDAEPSAFCVNAQQFARLVDAADDMVEFNIKGSSLIFSGQGEAELQILDAKDFPSAPKDELKQIILNAEDLLNVVKSVVWGLEFVRTTETDQRKLGLHILTAAKKILAEYQNGSFFVGNFLPSMAGDMDVIVLREFTNNLVEMLSGKDAKIFVGKNHLSVSNADGRWFCKLAETAFPSSAVDEIVNQNWVELGIILPEEVLPHLNLCHSFSTDNGDHIDLDFTKKGLRISYNNSNTSVDSPFKYEAEVPGKYAEQRLRYNLRYLLESVKRLNDEGSPIKVLTKEQHIKFTADNRPMAVIAGMARPKE